MPLVLWAWSRGGAFTVAAAVLPCRGGALRGRLRPRAGPVGGWGRHGGKRRGVTVLAAAVSAGTGTGHRSATGSGQGAVQRCRPPLTAPAGTRRYVLGGGARRLPGSAVLVSGLRGTGAQVATALVLAGTGRVVLHDCGTACTADRTQQVPAGPGGAPGDRYR